MMMMMMIIIIIIIIIICKFLYLVEFFLEWEIFQTKVVEKIKIHILCAIYLRKNRGVYEIIRKNMVQRETHRPQMTK